MAVWFCKKSWCTFKPTSQLLLLLSGLNNPRFGTVYQQRQTTALEKKTLNFETTWYPGTIVLAYLYILKLLGYKNDE